MARTCFASYESVIDTIQCLDRLIDRARQGQPLDGDVTTIALSLAGPMAMAFVAWAILIRLRSTA
jgi:hypothetical protein